MTDCPICSKDDIPPVDTIEEYVEHRLKHLTERSKQVIYAEHFLTRIDEVKRLKKWMER